MTSSKLEQELDRHRQFILKAELGALLHDIGKITSGWYGYRARWRQLKDGLTADPHPFLHASGADPGTWLDNFPALKICFGDGAIPGPQLAAGAAPVAVFPSLKSGDMSIERMVREHARIGARTRPTDSFTLILAAADTLDAAYNRNNPLFSADQKMPPIYESDIFGREKELTDKVDNVGWRLHRDLSRRLPKYLRTYRREDRDAILHLIRRHLEEALTDTTRPDNDTSLWEHSYAVASLFKVAVASAIIGEPVLEFQDFKTFHFGILGIAWDGLAYLSAGDKIVDILSREQNIRQLEDAIRSRIEHRYALGNLIYQDIDGIFFVVPSAPGFSFDSGPASRSEGYCLLLGQLRAEIEKTALRQTSGDLQPKFYLEPDTRFMTHLTRCMAELRTRIIFPVAALDPELRDRLHKHWRNARDVQDVCPVCLRRPAQKKKRGEPEVCRECARRRSSFLSAGREEEAGTPFISEITRAGGDGPRRAALVVARFDLNRWLSGRMVRTLLIKEPRTLQKEIEKDLADTLIEDGGISWKTVERRQKEEFDKHQLPYNWERVQTEIDLLYNNAARTAPGDKDYARAAAFLYAYRFACYEEAGAARYLAELKGEWDELKNAALEEYGSQPLENPDYLLHNVICAKTPTPSTVLDVWTTAEKFFRGLCEKSDNKFLGLGKLERPRVRLPKPPEAVLHMIYPGLVGPTAVEIVWRNDSEAIIIGLPWQGDYRQTLPGRTVWLKGRSFGQAQDLPTPGPIERAWPEDYYPVRVIATTPSLFLAIVPCGSALEVSSFIYDRYRTNLGKVTGRLPLSVGHIFFEEHTPMFAVLDAARRMVQNFEQLAKRPVTLRVSNIKDAGNGEQCKEIEFDQICFPGALPLSRTWHWLVPWKLGDGEPDYHHPYQLIEDGRACSVRPSYFKTVEGDVVHVADLEAGDTVRAYLNYYDFEFLDSTARRYDLALDLHDRRRSGVAPFLSRPYLFDGPKGGLQELWRKINERGEGALMPGLTDTQLRNMESLWLIKLTEWGVNPADRSSHNFQKWGEFVEVTLKREFSRYRGPIKPEAAADFNYLRNAIVSGMLFDCLELYLRILKERIGRPRKEAEHA